MEILSLKDINFNETIEENGTTFEENSMIKAKAIKFYCDKIGLKEDKSYLIISKNYTFTIIIISIIN